LIGSLKCSYLGSFFRRTRLSSKSSSSSSSSKNRLSLRGSLEKQKSVDFEEHEFKSILENYDIVNENYTKGIEITNAQLTGGNHYSIWEFSGYEPYQVFYDHFIGDHKCIHVIVYSLKKSELECIDEITYWLEFLRARIAPKEQIFHKGKCSNALKILLVGTHADIDKQCFKNEEGEYTSEKANLIFKQIFDMYQHEFDLCSKHFILDARVAWVSEIKLLIQYFNQLKESICDRLPRCTMFLSRTLHNVQNLRKTCTTYPIVEWRIFIDLIREKVNPLGNF
jgi:death-associated protein kinase